MQGGFKLAPKCIGRSILSKAKSFTSRGVSVKSGNSNVLVDAGWIPSAADPSEQVSIRKYVHAMGVVKRFHGRCQ
uniref:Uncharacterized protein n=1 Tax=Romanomermis culicivorax TaxID=13658 RepID=A0A915JP38_ROMCU